MQLLYVHLRFWFEAHISDNVLVATVGNSTDDHSVWIRPQDFDPTPRYLLINDPEHPGAESMFHGTSILDTLPFWV